MQREQRFHLLSNLSVSIELTVRSRAKNGVFLVEANHAFEITSAKELVVAFVEMPGIRDLHGTNPEM